MTASHSTKAADQIAQVSAFSPAEMVAPGPVGARWPRCERDALYGLECAHSGRVIITGLIGGPRLCPAEERAKATGRPVLAEVLNGRRPAVRHGRRRHVRPVRGPAPGAPSIGPYAGHGDAPGMAGGVVSCRPRRALEAGIAASTPCPAPSRRCSRGIPQLSARAFPARAGLQRRVRAELRRQARDEVLVGLGHVVGAGSGMLR